MLEAHSRATNLKKLDLDPAALNHSGEIGRVMISKAFPFKDEALAARGEN